jgi:hypothetical protein
MDKIDLVGFVAWSMIMAALDFSALQLVGLQAAWLAVYFGGRVLADTWINRKIEGITDER